MKSQQIPDATTTDGTARVEVHYCVPHHEARHLPKRRRAPEYVPSNAPIPAEGTAIYLAPNSAWAVVLVCHEWKTHNHLRIEIWLEHVTSTRRLRPTGFSITQ